jgi:hypothetical protein
MLVAFEITQEIFYQVSGIIRTRSPHPSSSSVLDNSWIIDNSVIFSLKSAIKSAGYAPAPTFFFSNFLTASFGFNIYLKF